MAWDYIVYLINNKNVMIEIYSFVCRFEIFEERKKPKTKNFDVKFDGECCITWGSLVSLSFDRNMKHDRMKKNTRMRARARDRRTSVEKFTHFLIRNLFIVIVNFECQIEAAISPLKPIKMYFNFDFY